MCHVISFYKTFLCGQRSDHRYSWSKINAETTKYGGLRKFLFFFRITPKLFFALFDFHQHRPHHHPVNDANDRIVQQQATIF